MFGESLDEEAVDASGVALILIVVPVTKTVFEGGEEIFRVKARAKLCHEMDIGGVGAAKIEEPQFLFCVE